MMKVAIAGFGAEGRASYEYWKRLGHEVVIADESLRLSDQPYDTECILGPEAFSKLDTFDLIIRAPGINPRKLPYGNKVWSATNEFFEKCPAPIIGVTGTKGKGTTCSLIASILKATGKRVHLVGNIGVPALKELESIDETDIVVYEMSSFQLWDIRRSPHIAVVLMVEPDHLDVHDGIEDYIHAKANITRHVTWNDIVYVYPNNEMSLRIANDYREVNKQPAIPFGIKQSGAVYEEDGFFRYGDDTIAPRHVLKLPGAHNTLNACAAIAVTLNFTDEYDAITRGLSSFDGLDHRLKFVRQVSDVSYYDDSIATTPGSAMAAISSFEEPKVVILGGREKGADYDELMQICQDTNTMVVAMGENRNAIKTLAEQKKVYCVKVDGGMSEVVREAQSIAPEHSVVIFSPAAASFDMFKNYSDRGNQFVEAVNDL